MEQCQRIPITSDPEGLLLCHQALSQFSAAAIDVRVELIKCINMHVKQANIQMRTSRASGVFFSYVNTASIR